MSDTRFDREFIATLRGFFNGHHDKLLCTANARGEPSVALMGSPKMLADGSIDLQISDVVSNTLDNIRENKQVVFVVYVPGERARDYCGARIYCEVSEVLTSGSKIDAIRQAIREKFGAEKAAELQATVNCTILKVRPIIDRGQRWDEAPD